MWNLPHLFFDGFPSWYYILVQIVIFVEAESFSGPRDNHHLLLWLTNCVEFCVFTENRILREAQERMVIVTLLLVQGVSQNLLPHTSIMHHEQPVRWLAVLAGTKHSEH